MRKCRQCKKDLPSFQDLISLVDADGNALVDFTEFLTLVAVRSQHAQSEEDLIEAFRLFDTEGAGTVQVCHPVCVHN